MTDKPQLTIEALRAEAAAFAEVESKYDEPALFGVTDGKAVGTYLEHKFTSYLVENYSFGNGNSAKGIDIPSLNVDIKVTSSRNLLAHSSQRARRFTGSGTTSSSLCMRRQTMPPPGRGGLT